MINDTPLIVEDLFLKLSRTYIPLIREKSAGDEKKIVLYTVYNVLMEILKIFAPISPYITETIYQNLKKEFNLKEESIHHFVWPKHDEKAINKGLEDEMDDSSDILQTIFSLREKIQMGVRWPLQEVDIVTTDKKSMKQIAKIKARIKKK